MEYTLDFYTAYNQFYISNGNGVKALKDVSADVFSSHNDRLIQLDNLLIVRTENYGHIKGDFFELNEERKNSDWIKYDHIVEAGIEVKLGLIQILDCPNSAIEFEIKINPGIYMIRVYFSNMAGYDTDEDEGSEYYRIELWPSERIQKNILKSYKN